LGYPIIQNTDEQILFRAIPKRHTNRHDYQDWDIPESLLKWLQKDAAAEGSDLQIIRKITTRHAIADLIARGDRLQMSSSDFRKELATWMHSSNSQSRDGIPVYAHGMDEHLDFVTPLFAFAFRNVDMGVLLAERSYKLLENSPAIAILTTPTDTPADWLATGQALEKILLRG
jgi:hypothetical protein